jgi:hypothetical protein
MFPDRPHELLDGIFVHRLATLSAYSSFDREIGPTTRTRPRSQYTLASCDVCPWQNLHSLLLSKRQMD